MPLPTAPNPWITHHSSVVFENPYVKLVRNEVTRPSGNPGLYTVVHFKRVAVAIIPVDEEGYTWLVGQYRYAHHRYEWEVPEGGAELDEAPEACAHRELREEAGLLATTLTPILEMQLSNSVTDEISHSFVATGLTQTDAEPEETEDLTVHRLPLSEAFAMALRGEIRDALSVASLLKLKYLLESGALTLGKISS
jgi:8-oxo-dGTP pyrophosphatase MutT (NUDIX family)